MKMTFTYESFVKNRFTAEVRPRYPMTPHTFVDPDPVLDADKRVALAFVTSP